VIVSNGMLRVNGSLGSSVWMDSDGGIGGSGTVGALEGAGTVVLGSTILTSDSVAGGLDYAFGFGKQGSPHYGNAGDSGNALLRLTGMTPIDGNLDSANTVTLFFDVAELHSNHVFRGGFFTDTDADFISSIDGANYEFYVRDSEGEMEFEGDSYAAYTGPLTFVVETVPATADFGDGAVNGRVMRVRFEEGQLPYEQWRADNFSPEEQEDPEVSGPLADPDDSGIRNLLRYALGLGRYDAYEHALPEGKVDETSATLHIRRLMGTQTGVEYRILVRDNLIGGEWRSVEMGTDLVELGAVPTGDGITEIVEYEVPGETLDSPKYFRLEVILVD